MFKRPSFSCSVTLAYPEIRPNFCGSHTFSRLKLGLIQTLSRLCSLRPDFGRNADWLSETPKLKALIPLVVVFVNDPPSVERKVDFAVFFIV